MTLGANIRAKREEKGMTQQELAAKLFVSRQTVSRWESGSRTPDVIMCKKIALVLEIPLDDLISGADLSGMEAAPRSFVDLSCMKVMLTGLILVLVATFLIAADENNMDFAAVCFWVGIGVFFAGLLIPWDPKEKVIVDDTLPQRKCPKCGKEHDFDFHKCPYCDFDYLRQKGGSHE